MSEINSSHLAEVLVLNIEISSEVNDLVDTYLSEKRVLPFSQNNSAKVRPFFSYYLVVCKN